MTQAFVFQPWQKPSFIVSGRNGNTNVAPSAVTLARYPIAWDKSLPCVKIGDVSATTKHTMNRKGFTKKLKQDGQGNDGRMQCLPLILQCHWPASASPERNRYVNAACDTRTALDARAEAPLSRSIDCSLVEIAVAA